MSSRKKVILPMRNTLADFFWHYRVRQTSFNILLGSTRQYSNHCARYKILSVTLNRLFKTQILKTKNTFQRKAFFGQFFLVLPSLADIRYLFVRLYKVFWNHVANYKICSVLPERFLKTQFLKQEVHFPPKKLFQPTFCRMIKYKKIQGTIFRGPQVIVTVIVQVISSFS